MFDRLFYRNMHARDNLEIFLVSAVSSLLILRFILYLAGYPQVGGGSLHIAHMLYGGLLMLAAIVLLVNFLGSRVQRLASLIGGAGFGIFIDELGKFLTKDNNYFFRPTIGIIYAVFIILYLLFNLLSKGETFTSREYQFNALLQFEEAIAHDLDASEKIAIRRLLQKANSHDALTKELKSLLLKIETVPVPPPNFVRRLENLSAHVYQKFWKQASSARLVSSLFVAEALIFALLTILNVVHNFDDVRSLFNRGDSYSQHLIIGQIVAASVAAGFTIAGAIRLPSSRRRAFELFRTAIFINLFLTEFFIFSRIQFRAIPGFLLNLAIIIGLRFALYQERRSPEADKITA